MATYALMLGNWLGGYEVVEVFRCYHDAVNYANEHYSRSDWYIQQH